MNKEECLHALKDVKYALCRNNSLMCFKNGVYQLKARYQREVDLLEQLINEHFDNPPLKFEELHENMWVWDNEDKEWCKFISEHLFEYMDGYGGVFEENRFYRKEVKE